MPLDPPTTGWPQLDDEQVEAATRVLRSGRLNYWTGDEGKRFEQEYAESVGQPHAVAVSNGTVALELALVALGVGPGDEVIVPARTFIATASCVAVRGATPVCADVDPDSQNLTAATIEAKLTPRTKAVIPVHLAGWPCDMPAICELAAAHGLLVIEDCSQAHGATIEGRQVGSFGDAATFSFCQDKIITTAGEGGMLLLRSETAWRKAWSYKDHGKDYDTVHSPADGTGFRWLHHAFGTNGRMTEVQAAIGRIALRRLPEWLSTRRENGRRLADGLRSTPGLRVPEPPAHIGHANYKWYAFVQPESLAPGWDRDRVLDQINQNGTPCFSGSCGEIYRERAFRSLHPEGVRLPVAQRLGETSLMLLVDPTRTAASMSKAVEDVTGALRLATSRRSEAA